MGTVYRILIRLAIAWLVIVGGGALAIGAFVALNAKRDNASVAAAASTPTVTSAPDELDPDFERMLQAANAANAAKAASASQGWSATEWEFAAGVTLLPALLLGVLAWIIKPVEWTQD